MNAKPTHPVAILRGILGMTQEQFSRFIECSIYTVQSIEGGSDRLKLSEHLAMRISIKTGVSVAWLLAGDGNASPLDLAGNPYTKNAFEQMQAGLKFREIDTDEEIADRVEETAGAMFALILYAQGHSDARLFHFKLQQAIGNTCEKFFPELSKHCGTIPDLRGLASEIANEWKGISVSHLFAALNALAARELGSEGDFPIPDSWYGKVDDGGEYFDYLGDYASSESPEISALNVSSKRPKKS